MKTLIILIAILALASCEKDNVSIDGRYQVIMQNENFVHNQDWYFRFINGEYSERNREFQSRRDGEYRIIDGQVILYPQRDNYHYFFRNGYLYLISNENTLTLKVQ